ncbi:MAG: mycothiol system anti-sigma-R factor [Streptosporangiaceae bacterium]
MSCGRPHAVPCSEVLDRMYSYLDGEMDQASYAQVKLHLEECGPCLREYGLEEAVKHLVHKHCGHEEAPQELKRKVLDRIHSARSQMETG